MIQETQYLCLYDTDCLPHEHHGVDGMDASTSLPAGSITSTAHVLAQECVYYGIASLYLCASWST